MGRFSVGRGFSACSVLLCALALACSDDGEMTGNAGAMAPVTGGQGGAGAAGGQPDAAGAAGMTQLPVGGMSGAGAGAGGGQPVSGGSGGVGGQPMTGGSGGGTPDGGVDSAVPMDDFVSPCITNEADVVLIGDSYVDWITHTFPADMRAEAGQQWPSYAIGATSMATGGLGRIPDQIPTAFGDNPNIKAIVMTGGGNDILVADTVMFPDGGMCTSVANAPMIEDCQKIVQAALDEAVRLMDDTADRGVRDIVYFFYPHIPGGGLISGPTPNPILDYALPRAREVCESSLERTDGRMRCTFVDMVPAFEGKTGLFSDAVSEAGDGVHPNSMGSKVMAEEIWTVMKEKCIGQPASSGCCMP
jgi:lysophospholipase L1-like esterase